MSAREIDKATDIAAGVGNLYGGTIFTGRDRDNIELGLRRLTAAGYTIVPPGGVHEPTLEKAAKVADKYWSDENEKTSLHPALGWTDEQKDWWRTGQLDGAAAVAAAIRALATRHKGDDHG